jgi:glycosyltransferase involved in cell wall biosynthesis
MMEIKSNKPKVSVVMITYGHEKYIKDAIEGVLSQDCNFDFELILSNDASPDKTDYIINEIINEHPLAHKIKYTLHGKNIGMMPNSIFALTNCSGDYIASCEGDDYWTDSNKLQTQVDFLENNREYIMTFHAVDVLFANSNDYYKYPQPTKDTLDLQDIIRNHYIATCSLVFRADRFKNGYPNWLEKSISGDIPIEILLASEGLVKYFDKQMACYRRNEGGISLSPIQIDKMRDGYIFMYRKLLLEIGIYKGYYLIYIISRLFAGKIKIKIINILNKFNVFK